MDIDPSLIDLLERYKDLQAQGRPVSLEELCQGRPELLEPLRQHLLFTPAAPETRGPGDSVKSAEDVPIAPLASKELCPETKPLDGSEDPLGTIPPEEEFHAPQVAVPGYDTLGELGRGGMGVVYKARHRTLNRVVALKMILAGSHADSQLLARFRIEAEAIARIQHPNIVQVFEVGEYQGLPFFSLEYCPGGSLADRLRGTPLPGTEAAKVTRVLAQAMQAAHDRKVIHRDLKPANVLLAEDGTAKVTDFGLAKKLDDTGQTHPGEVMGTPSYMAPEQARGQLKHIGPPADIYALGAILYECLTGRPPFRAATVMDTLLQVIEQEPVPPARLNPGVSRDLETICLKCLQKDPLRRYASAQALADDLGRCLNGEPIQARPVGAGERAVKWVRRRPLVSTLLAAILVLAAGGLTGILLALDDARQSASSEKKQKEEADTQRDLARKKARESTLGLDRQYVANAQRHFSENDWLGGLPWLTSATALHEDKEDKEDRNGARVRTHRLRLGLILQHSPRLAQAWFCGGSVSEVAFSPDGKLIATASQDGTVRIWNTATGADVAPPLQHDFPVLCVSFAPDGSKLVTAAGDTSGRRGPGEARIWEVKTGKQLAHLRHRIPKPNGFPRQPMNADYIISRTGVILSAQFSPDSARVLTAADDGTARQWDALTGKPFGLVLVHADPVRGARYSHDGRWIVAVAQYGKGHAFVWNASTGQRRGSPVSYDDSLSQAEFNPSGTRLLLAGGRGASLHDASSGETIEKLAFDFHYGTAAAFSPDGRRLVISGESQFAAVRDLDRKKWITPRLYHPGVRRVAFSPDGRRVFTAGSGVRVWDARTGTAAVPMLDESGEVAAFSPDGRHIAVASGSSVRFWDLSPGQADILPLPRGHSWDDDAVLSADAQRLASVSSVSTAKGYETEVRVWDLTAGKPLTPPLWHDLPVRHAQFSSDGKLLAVACGDKYDLGKPKRGFVRVWNVETGKLAFPALEHPGPAARAVFSPQGGLLVTACEDHCVRVWDATTGKLKFEPLKHSYPHTGVSFGPQGWLLTFASRGEHTVPAEVRVWDSSTGHPLIDALTVKTVPISLWSDPAGQRLLLLGKEPTVGFDKREAWLWELPSGRLVKGPLKASADAEPLFTDDGRLVLLNEGVFDLGEGQHVRSIGSGTDLRRIGERWLAVSKENREVRLRDIGTGGPVLAPLLHDGAVELARLSPDGRVLATLSRIPARGEYSGGELRLWDAETAELLAPPLPLPVPSGAITGALLQFSPDSRRLTAVTRQYNLLAVRSLALDLDETPLPRLTQLAAALSNRGIDATGGHVRMPLREAWEALPPQPAIPSAALARWHQREAADSESVCDSFAALWHLDKLVELAPNDTDLLGRRADSYRERQLWVKAIADYTRLTQLEVKTSRVWHGLAECHAARKTWQEARRCYTKAIEAGTASEDSWIGRAVVLAELGKSKEAADDLNLATRLWASNVVEGQFSEHVKKQQEAGNWAAAVCLLDVLLALPFLSGAAGAYVESSALAARGHARLMLKQWAQASADYTRAIEKGGDAWWVRTDRAVARAILNQDDKVMPDLREALKTEKTETIHARVVEHLTHALRGDAENENLWIVLGQLHGTFKHNREAVEAFSRALALDADNYSVWRLRALGYCKLAQWDKAGPDFGRSVETGADMQETGKEALSLLTQGLKEKASDASVWAWRGWAALWTNAPEKAESDFNRSLELNAKQPRALAGRGILRLRKMDVDGATMDLEQADKLEPRTPLYLYHLAKIPIARLRSAPEGERKKHLARSLDYLEAACKNGFSNWELLKSDLDFALLRTEQRFKALLPSR